MVIRFIHAEDFSLSSKSNLMHIAPLSEDNKRQLSNCGQWFLFLKEMKWLSVLENYDNQLPQESHGISKPFPCSWYAVSCISFESFIIIWRCTFPILNSSTSEDIVSCRFPELVYKPTFEKQGGTPSHLCRYLLLYCWTHSMQDSAILYVCKGHKRQGSRPCW